MAISDTTTKNLMATYYSTLVTHAAWHTADAATSANELTGTGSSRGAISWGTAGATGAGIIIGTATVTAPTAGGTGKSIGGWSALTSGTFRDGQFDVIDITYGAGGGSANVTISFTQA
jgi:hypothetical protein